jgi:hypothetical protein
MTTVRDWIGRFWRTLPQLRRERRVATGVTGLY